MPPVSARRRAPAARGPLSIALVLLGLFVTGVGLGEATDLPGWGAERTSPPPRALPVLTVSPPERLVIPALGVAAPVVPVGLAPDGSIAAPSLEHAERTGWYDLGPSPGESGPAVIVGHLDTRRGPAVFYRLARLRPGARVEVVRRDGRVAVFQVNRVEQHAKSALPADRVFGDFSRPGLRLITCGGRWRGSHGGYADNVIVFASLVGAYRG